MSKPSHDCPLCEGTGKVSARVASAKIVVRDREKYNETMKAVNAKARARKKSEEGLAT